MTEIVATGWDGSNPLHLLAALGTLILATQLDADATLVWRWSGRWTPVFGHRIPAWTDASAAADALAERLRALGSTGSVDSAVARRVDDFKAARKRIEKDRKVELAAIKTDKSMHVEARRAKMDTCAADFDRRLAAQDEELARAQDLLNDALGAGIAHLGSIIGVPPALFRRKAQDACRAWLEDRATPVGATSADLVAAALAAQACDVVAEKGLVVPSPLSFSNGSSGQCLLKDFRGCAAVCMGQSVVGSWSGHPVMDETITGLNWDPADQRSYALQWASPESGRSHDPAANALAFVGLSQFTAMPMGARITAVGWILGRPDGMRWPLWDVRLTLPVVGSLLAADPEQVGLRLRPGVVAVMASHRINPTGKRNFFAPACSV